MVPAFLRRICSETRKVFLIGGSDSTVNRAKLYCLENFPCWVIVGINHGFFLFKDEDDLIKKINYTSPDILLVGMGSPIQEVWINKNKHKIKVPLCIGVGGLFEYWGNGLRRAPKYFIRSGLEWLWLLFQRPERWRKCINNIELLMRSILFQKKINCFEISSQDKK